MGVKVTGTEKIEQNLKKMIVGEVIRAALIKVVTAGAEVLLEEAASNAPNPSDVGMRVTTKTKTKAVAKVGPVKDKWYLRFMETGATRHEIKGYPLIFEGVSGDVIKTFAVDHPGMAARPFLRPAMDRKGDEAMEAGGKAFWNAMVKQI